MRPFMSCIQLGSEPWCRVLGRQWPTGVNHTELGAIGVGGGTAVSVARPECLGICILKVIHLAYGIHTCMLWLSL